MNRPSPEQTSVNLKARTPQPGALPHENDQAPSSHKPAARQDKQKVAVEGYADAQRGRPDTSAAPQLQQPSPAESHAAGMKQGARTEPGRKPRSP